MAAVAILDCLIHKISLADSGQMAQTHQFDKFCENWSFHCGDVAIFGFSRWPPQPFWIFKIAKFYCLLGSRRSRRISMLNFVKICQSVAKILTFFVFQDGGRRHLGLSNSQNFIDWQCLYGPDASLYQISSILVVPSRRYCDFRIFKMPAAAILNFWIRVILLANVVECLDAPACQISSKSVNRLRIYWGFSIFQDGGCRHLEFAKSCIFISWRYLEGPDASLYPILSKSVVPLRRYCNFSNFSRWPPPPSWIFEIAKFYWLLGYRGSRRIFVPNFVKIGQSVAKILRFFRFFNMAAAAILDFQICEIVLADGVWIAQTHNCAKFRHNRSFRCRDIAIFRIFKMAAAAILDFWNREILLIIRV